MKIAIQSKPGYRVNEYSLVLNPHEELRNKIIQVRKEFNDSFSLRGSVWGKPNITLVQFKQRAMMEERIVNRFKAIAMGYHPFKVELKDYAAFPSHTIYVNVISKEPIRGLINELKTAQRLLKLNDDHKPHFINEPYIMVARKLLPWQFEKGWLEYSQKQFTGRFIADSILLLKRAEGEKAYQIVERLELLNLPVLTRQGELF